MGLASNQARLNVLTLRKTDLEYRLMMVSSKSQQLAVLEANASAKKSQALQIFLDNNAKGEGDKVVAFQNTQAYTDYEKSMAELEAAQNRLDCEQKLIETQLNAVNNEQEQVKKTVEANVKTSFKLFQ